MCAAAKKTRSLPAKLRRRARFLLHDPEEARDVVQETLLAIHLKRHT